MSFNQTQSPTIDALLAEMTLMEKIGQMTQVEKNSISPEEVREYAIGSVLSGGGGNPTPNNPENWAAMVHEFQAAALETRLRIPIIYGSDAVHGHSNVVGAVIFPHNVGLGAARNPELVEKIGRITAIEMLATGVHWAFAPALAVPQDIRWGRIYEGYGQNTALVTELGIACLRGLQSVEANNNRVLTCPKHFVADGGAMWGTTKYLPWLSASNWQAATPNFKIDQGDAQLEEATLREVHLRPYEAAVAAGALNIMVSLSSWNGVKLHQHQYLLTDVLKTELGFEGFLVSDWGAIDQLDEDYYTCVVRAINAGLDMAMVPMDYRRYIEAVAKSVENGDIPESRVDDAVRRILHAKFAVGLFDNPWGDPSLLPLVGCEAHREVARDAVRQSLVLLKNENNLLPLDKNMASILIAGRGANDIGLQCGGWSIEWQGLPGEITTGKTIFQGIRRIASDTTEIALSENGEMAFDEPVDVGIVVLAETPYAEGLGDLADLTLPADDIALLERVRKQCRKMVVILLAGRPRIITEQLPMMDALIAAWLPGSEGDAIAEVLFGDYSFIGKLPYAFPRNVEQVPVSALEASAEAPLFEFGFGLT